jgi:hypothetical protein
MDKIKIRSYASDFNKNIKIKIHLIKKINDKYIIENIDSKEDISYDNYNELYNELYYDVAQIIYQIIESLSDEEKEPIKKIKLIVYYIYSIYIKIFNKNKDNIKFKNLYLYTTQKLNDKHCLRLFKEQLYLITDPSIFNYKNIKTINFKKNILNKPINTLNTNTSNTNTSNTNTLNENKNKQINTKTITNTLNGNKNKQVNTTTTTITNTLNEPKILLFNFDEKCEEILSDLFYISKEKKNKKVLQQNIINNFITYIEENKPAIVVVCTRNSLSKTNKHYQHSIKNRILGIDKNIANYFNLIKVDSTLESNLYSIKSIGKKFCGLRTRIYVDQYQLLFSYKEKNLKSYTGVGNSIYNEYKFTNNVSNINNELLSNRKYETIGNIINYSYKRITGNIQGTGAIIVKIELEINNSTKQYIFCNYNLKNINNIPINGKKTNKILSSVLKKNNIHNNINNFIYFFTTINNKSITRKILLNNTNTSNTNTSKTNKLFNKINSLNLIHYNQLKNFNEKNIELYKIK